MLRIKLPNICFNEIDYVVKVVFSEFLGVDFDAEIYDGDCLEISMSGCCKVLKIDMSFFHSVEKKWGSCETLPILPLQNWEYKKNGLSANLLKDYIPVLYGNPGFIQENNTTFTLKVDIFGSIFFMLSRYEEMLISETDEHSRFASKSSIAAKAGFLDRPIVNEYLEVFWSIAIFIWPNLKRKKNIHQKYISCDVDWPFDTAMTSLKQTMKKSLYSLIKEKSIRRAIVYVIRYIQALSGLKAKDSYRDAIDWVMDVNEKAGNKVAFYFITYPTSKFDYNRGYSTEKLKELLIDIHSRGHEIGIHPGYATYNNRSNFSKSVAILRGYLEELNISQDSIGGRQHFLRWDVRQTPHLWEENNLAYDSTLGYADRAGFRCGTSYEYTMYDLINRVAFRLKQRPLLVMDCTVISKRYENLGYSQDSFYRFMYFKSAVKRVNGNFSLLWHNSHFENPEDKKFYRKLIE